MIITNEQILALLTVIIPVIVSLVAYLYRVLVSKMPAQKQAIMYTVVHDATRMAEQVLGTGNGTAKKAMVEAAVSSGLKSLGVSVSPALVNTAIESAVFSLNQQAPHLVISPVDTSMNNG